MEGRGGTAFHPDASTHQGPNGSDAGHDLQESTWIPLVGEQSVQTHGRRSLASSSPAIGKDEAGTGYSSRYGAFWSAASYRSIAEELLLTGTRGHGGGSGASLPPLR